GEETVRYQPITHRLVAWVPDEAEALVPAGVGPHRPGHSRLVLQKMSGKAIVGICHVHGPGDWAFPLDIDGQSGVSVAGLPVGTYGGGIVGIIQLIDEMAYMQLGDPLAQVELRVAGGKGDGPENAVAETIAAAAAHVRTKARVDIMELIGEVLQVIQTWIQIKSYF